MSDGANLRLRAVHALHKVREVEERQAEARLHLKRMEVLKLRGSIQSLDDRKSVILQRCGGSLLRDRMLLDSLVRLSLERRRQLAALDLQSAVLLAEWRQARARKDATRSLREKRQREVNLILERRGDEATSLLAAVRLSREVEEAEEAAQCEEQ